MTRRFSFPPKRALAAAGYKVLTAASGAEALQTCARPTGELQLLVTDVVMPHMSGKALAEEVLKTRPALKVLYMLGYTDDQSTSMACSPRGHTSSESRFHQVDFLRNSSIMKTDSPGWPRRHAAAPQNPLHLDGNDRAVDPVEDHGVAGAHDQ